MSSLHHAKIFRVQSTFHARVATCVAARGERCQHLLYGSADRPLVDRMGIDLSLSGPVPHLLGRRPIERIDDHLAQNERICPIHDHAIVRKGRVTFDRSGRKANPEIWRCARLPVTFARKRRRNQVVHTTLYFEGARRDLVREGWFACKTEPESPVSCEGARLGTDRLNLQRPRRLAAQPATVAANTIAIAFIIHLSWRRDVRSTGDEPSAFALTNGAHPVWFVAEASSRKHRASRLR